MTLKDFLAQCQFWDSSFIKRTKIIKIDKKVRIHKYIRTTFKLKGLTSNIQVLIEFHDTFFFIILKYFNQEFKYQFDERGRNINLSYFDSRRLSPIETFHHFIIWACLLYTFNKEKNNVEINILQMSYQKSFELLSTFLIKTIKISKYYKPRFFISEPINYKKLIQPLYDYKSLSIINKAIKSIFLKIYNKRIKHGQKD